MDIAGSHASPDVEVDICVNCPSLLLTDMFLYRFGSRRHSICPTSISWPISSDTASSHSPTYQRDPKVDPRRYLNGAFSERDQAAHDSFFHNRSAIGKAWYTGLPSVGQLLAILRLACSSGLVSGSIFGWLATHART